MNLYSVFINLADTSEEKLGNNRGERKVRISKF